MNGTRTIGTAAAGVSKPIPFAPAARAKQENAGCVLSTSYLRLKISSSAFQRMMYLSPSEPFQTIMSAQKVDIAIGERKPQFRKATAYHAIVSRAIIIKLHRAVSQTPASNHLEAGAAA